MRGFISVYIQPKNPEQTPQTWRSHINLMWRILPRPGLRRSRLKHPLSFAGMDILRLGKDFKALEDWILHVWSLARSDMYQSTRGGVVKRGSEKVFGMRFLLDFSSFSFAFFWYHYWINISSLVWYEFPAILNLARPVALWRSTTSRVQTSINQTRKYTSSPKNQNAFSRFRPPFHDHGLCKHLHDLGIQVWISIWWSSRPSKWFRVLFGFKRAECLLSPRCRGNGVPECYTDGVDGWGELHVGMYYTLDFFLFSIKNALSIMEVWSLY